LGKEAGEGMANRQKSYLYHGQTTSLCSRCGAVIPAKIIIEEGAVYLLKRCQEHGEHRELLEEDAEWYLNRGRYEKPGTRSETQTEIGRGCPHDCGLCPDHEQHTCIGLVEVTDRCDLGCPVCYANAGKWGQPPILAGEDSFPNGEAQNWRQRKWGQPPILAGEDSLPSGEAQNWRQSPFSEGFLDLPTIERMLDVYLQSESGEAEILQISGGEPTLHPQILDIIRLAKGKGFRFVMLNTNGLRIAEDPAFAKALHEFYGGFEVYLQFDGFTPKAYESLRGRDLSAVKGQAVRNLAEAGVPMTLVTTVHPTANGGELGRIIQFGLDTPFIRGINFQPVARFGRSPDDAGGVTLTGILHRIERQTKGMVRVSDFIPLPCNVDRVAISYLYREKDTFIPVMRNAKIRDYLPLIKNTLLFDARDILSQTAAGLLKGQYLCECLGFLKDFLPLAPLGKNLRLEDGKVKYNIENTFRLSVTSFIDRYNFELRALKKECVHILTPDLRKIPFSAYNLFYRGTRDA